MTFRTRVLLYILAFSLFIVLWRFWNAPPIAQDSRTTAGAPRATQTIDPTTPTVPPSEGEEIAPDATPVMRPTTVGPLVVGGLTVPELPPSMTDTSDPLTLVLRDSLSATLLDAFSGQPGEDTLATGWSIDDREIRFTLRDDVDSSDVLRAMRAALQGGELPEVSSIRVAGRELAFAVQGASCAPLWRIATWPVVLEGPQPIDEDEWGIPSAAGEWIYQFYEDELALREAWERGEIDGVVGAHRLTEGPPLDGGEAAAGGNLLATLLFNVKDDALSEPSLREALSLAIDRDALFEQAYGGEAMLLNALLPPGHWAAPAGDLPYDPEEASALLAEMGWRDRDGDGTLENTSAEPLTLQLTLPLSEDHRWETLAHLLVQQWGAVGVEVEPLFLESYTVQERLHHGRWQVALAAYQTRGDPDQRAMWRAPSDDPVENDLNVTGYDSAPLATLLDAAVSVADCDFAEQQALYRSAWETLLEEKPLWPLFALPLDLWLRPEAAPPF